ncbi:heparinase II/III family protein [Asaia siamensis]|uniref:Heparinase n=1 Tax=Asaia siamensis TaxID=110479 RepID=A0ABQ1LAI8_9PROT|nr:heparinase II/III family protein [Asaia siamensis]GGC20869.1 heparinase [Asaia siamensis]
MFGRWAREARLSLARLPSSVPGIARAPDRPVHAIRDIWPGNPDHGALLVSGAARFEGRNIPLRAHDWEYADLAPVTREWLQGFTWLRDLRALGSDEARLYARSIVGSWLDQPPIDPLVLNAPATGARLASWLGHFDFFASSASEAFRQKVMDRLLVEGRLISIMLPLAEQGWRNLTALKGLLAVAVAIPSQTGFLHRFHRYLDQELDRLTLPDGTLRERSPQAQMEAARELAEISVFMRMAQLSPSEKVQNALARICPVLRALRHGDGSLALFHGSKEQDDRQIDRIIQYGARQRLLASSMPDGGFWRISVGKALLFVDGAPPAGAPHDGNAHAAPLALEFSHGRQRLFVNCGAASTGMWKQALRETAAHSSLVVEETSCCDFTPAGTIARRPAHVTLTHQSQDGAHWVDGQHDGWYPGFGASWRRRLYLGPTGEDLRGEECVDGERRVAFALRFHLHPSVQAELAPDGDEVLMHAGGMIWRFRQEGGVLSLERSVYAGGEKPVASHQIVIRPPAAEVTAVSTGSDAVTTSTSQEPKETEGAPEGETMPSSQPGEPGEAGAGATADTQSPTTASAPALPELPHRNEPLPARQVVQWVMERVPE